MQRKSYRRTRITQGQACIALPGVLMLGKSFCSSVDATVGHVQAGPLSKQSFSWQWGRRQLQVANAKPGLALWRILVLS
jgi:hypothetical protein